MWRPAGWIFQPFGSSVTPLPRLPGQAGGAGARRATVPTAAETKMTQARAMAAKWRLRKEPGFISSFLHAQATMPSGFVVFQLPRVKSGNSCGAPFSFTDFSLSGATADQKQPS